MTRVYVVSSTYRNQSTECVRLRIETLYYNDTSIQGRQVDKKTTKKTNKKKTKKQNKKKAVVLTTHFTFNYTNYNE